MSSQSVVGGDRGLNPGEEGYTADWVHHICPELVPWSVWHTLEEILGNMLAHEFFMIIIANDEKIKEKLRARRYRKLPGMKGSPVPSFRRIVLVAELLDKAGRQQVGGIIRRQTVQEKINGYLRLIDAQPISLAAWQQLEPVPEASSVASSAGTSAAGAAGAAPSVASSAGTSASETVATSAGTAPNTAATSAGTAPNPVAASAGTSTRWLSLPERAASPARTVDGFPLALGTTLSRAETRTTGKLLI